MDLHAGLCDGLGGRRRGPGQPVALSVYRRQQRRQRLRAGLRRLGADPGPAAGYRRTGAGAPGRTQCRPYHARSGLARRAQRRLGADRLAVDTGSAGGDHLLQHRRRLVAELHAAGGPGRVPGDQRRGLTGAVRRAVERSSAPDVLAWAVHRHRRGDSCRRGPQGPGAGQQADDAGPFRPAAGTGGLGGDRG